MSGIIRPGLSTLAVMATVMFIRIRDVGHLAMLFPRHVVVAAGVAVIHPHLVMGVGVAVIRGLLAAVVVPDIGTHLTGVEVVEAEAEAASVEAVEVVAVEATEQ